MATGDNFVLGKSNYASKDTSLAGAALSLYSLTEQTLHVGSAAKTAIEGITNVVGLPPTRPAGVVGVAGQGAIGVRGVSFYSTGVSGEGKIGVHGDGYWGGVVGESQDQYGVYGHSKNWTGVVGSTNNPRTNYAGYFWGPVGISGDLRVFGKKSAAVPFPDGSHRLMYAIESPENWFEDFGSGRLVRGRGRVKLDRQFASVVRAANYHVFLSPEGDSRGMYVTKKTRTGFEVREQQHGTSTIRSAR